MLLSVKRYRKFGSHRPHTMFYTALFAQSIAEVVVASAGVHVASVDTDVEGIAGISAGIRVRGRCPTICCPQDLTKGDHFVCKLGYLGLFP